jgi:1-acyl-sn-glycerol-3-phosphate acyltransferase
VILTRVVHWILRRLGWKFEGALPTDPKMIVIGAPHTSNWDFLIFMAAIDAYRMTPRYLGKHTLFRWPLRSLLLALGGIPVDRSRPGGVVAQVAEEFERQERLILVIAPEGTRRKTPHWKSGFAHIVEAARVPVVPGVLDFANKTLTLAPPIRYEGDTREFMDRIRTAYEQSSGLRPKWAGPIRLADES